MNKFLGYLAVGLWLVTALQVEAIPVVGSFSGLITSTGGSGSAYPLGTMVTGSYGYDTDFLNGRQTSYSDPSVFFLIYINGLAFAGYTPNSSGLTFSVDANGEPVTGGGGQLWDLYIGNNGLLSLVSGTGPDFNRILAQVTYNTPQVPDNGPTFLLMGVALVGLVFVKRVSTTQTAGHPVKVKATGLLRRRLH